MSLTIEQLKFAREIGATHWDIELESYRKDGCIYRNDSWRDGLFAVSYSEYSDVVEIDFTPLEDYYADKAVDIAATSVPDGYYHDDEGDKLKPLKSAPVPDHDTADMVNHPPHYQTGGIECIDAIRASLGLEGFVDYCRGNSIKYAWRAGKKGEAVQDLRKAAWYLNRVADELTKETTE